MTTPTRTPAQIWEHELKTWPDYYAHLVDGSKTFEYRRDDRGFRVGDVLYLREWEPLAYQGGEPTNGRYTGREMHRRVTYILRVSADFVVMALSADLLASHAAEPPQTGWQPIETASKDRELLLWWPYWSSRPTIGYWKHDRWIAENALQDSVGGIGPQPTHWMPLPAPPQDGQTP